MLCAKAGVSHRARSTIASQLYDAEEPMALFELQAWLGHRDLNSPPSTTPKSPLTHLPGLPRCRQFGRNVRTIEILIDPDAVTSGTTAIGEPWPHMACTRCGFHSPKGSPKAQLLQAKENVQRMLAASPLTDDERAAVDDGQAVFDQPLHRLADVATPAGPTPREC